MKMFNKLWIGVAATLVSFAALSEAPKVSLQVGLGSAEYAAGGTSEHGTQYELAVMASWEQGFLLGLEHLNQDYSDVNDEFNYTRLNAGWRFMLDEQWHVDLGLEVERLDAEVGGVKASDDGYGGFVGVGLAISDAVTAGLELSYSETDEDDEVFDTVARIDMAMSDTVSVGMKYWARNITASGVSGELDQETISIVLGLHF